MKPVLLFFDDKQAMDDEKLIDLELSGTLRFLKPIGNDQFTLLITKKDCVFSRHTKHSYIYGTTYPIICLDLDGLRDDIKKNLEIHFPNPIQNLIVIYAIPLNFCVYSRASKAHIQHSSYLNQIFIGTRQEKYGGNLKRLLKMDKAEILEFLIEFGPRFTRELNNKHPYYYITLYSKYVDYCESKQLPVPLWKDVVILLYDSILKELKNMSTDDEALFDIWIGENAVFYSKRFDEKII